MSVLTNLHPSVQRAVCEILEEQTRRLHRIYCDLKKIIAKLARTSSSKGRSGRGSGENHNTSENPIPTSTEYSAFVCPSSMPLPKIYFTLAKHVGFNRCRLCNRLIAFCSKQCDICARLEKEGYDAEMRAW